MPLTEGQKPSEAAPPEGEKPSKNALKKAAKEKEKAEKAAKREQQEREEKEKAAANDTASHLYGHLNYEAPPPFAEKFVDLEDLESIEEDSRVTFEARVGNARVQSAKLGFLVLKAGFDSIQVVIAEGGGQSISRQMIKWCGALHTESIVRVTGLIKAPKEEVKSTTISHHELHLESIYIVAEAPEQLPIQVKDCNQPPPGEEEGEAEKEGMPNVGLKARLDNKVLSLRAPASKAIRRLESEVSRLFFEYMIQHKFTDIQPSYLAGAATEGGAEVFEVKYFEERAFLTQSPQFFKQMAIAGGMKRVFSKGPVFRAENSNTKRHLTEFTGLDFEMTIRHHYHEVLSFGESLMIYIIRGLQTQEYPKKLTNIIKEAGYPEAGTFQLPPGDQAIRITFAEAKALLSEAGVEAGEPDSDIDTAQEKALGKIMLEKYKTDFYTVDQYPRSLRPFYTHPSPHDPALTNSYDFFMRGQEIMSGAQRIHIHGELLESMRMKGVSPEDEGYRHYTEAFKWGCSPHGGGGLGMNRIVQYFLGLNNIREAALFPRDPGRLAP
ncbi:hypothetical protein HO173_008156 [Letharia columbiana]|uniref:Probable aspartate--tRNA ligase, cytoplasmic n=1 Tax=Letharia columbiana TaxID=112416 RepID=A0A8H6FRY0_9LECA|nr:uncharacterized protein HO173_008156 [Letharia columbiana]KAF6233599.1 hypothetical protein HO173_008156 [Letharia columbiana]